MALSERQLSGLLGYVADPDRNALPCDSQEHVSHLIMVMHESQKQQKQGFLPVVQHAWVDFLPWHSVN